jgi:hypothetical protein
MRKQRNPTDHRPIHATFSSIGIKKLVLANCTEIHRRDRACRHTLLFYLATDQALEVKSSLVLSIIPYNRLPLRYSCPEPVQYRIVHFIAAGTSRGADTDP